MFRSIWDDIVNQIRQGNVVLKIILACISVFLVVETFHLFCWANKYDAFFVKVYGYLALPISLHRLLHQPWSIVTFMFMHADVNHILWNMLFLYWFGEIYQLYMRDRRIFPIFFFGSLIGSALSILMYHLLPPLRPGIALGSLVGASAGITAIMFAATALNPDHKVGVLFIGQISLKYVTLGLFLMDYLALTYGNAGGEIAHIGGAIFGYLYIKALQSGTDWFKPLDKISTLFSRKSKLKATYVNTTKDRKDSPSDNEQKKLDAILDKIAKSGYNSLSKEEREFLFKFSNK